jgi:hypothetical protein
VAGFREHSPPPICIALPGTPFATDTRSVARTGWSLGGGLGSRIYENWLRRGEYRFSYFGTRSKQAKFGMPGRVPATVAHQLKASTQMSRRPGRPAFRPKARMARRAASLPWPSTIFVLTKSSASARRSNPRAQPFAISRSMPWTSTRSRCLQQNSRLTCAKSPPAPCPLCGEQFAPSSRLCGLFQAFQAGVPFDRNPL